MDNIIPNRDIENANTYRRRRFPGDYTTTQRVTVFKSSHNLSDPNSMRKRTASTDMLSRNISILLENLLKSYEQSQLPTHGQGMDQILF